ncbi:MAG: response regulator [Bacteroidota bacterium]
MKPGNKKNNHPKILIVEDSPTQATKLKYFLESKSYHVETASNGKEALKIIPEFDPSIILSDILMPGMDGYELCRVIKSDDKLNHIAVILLTSLSDSEYIIKGLLCGANNFIVKPYDEEYLLSRIEYLQANLELRKHGQSQIGVEIFFAGQKHLITSDRIQIIDLLMSTYETALQKNRELERAKDELSKLNSQLVESNKELETFAFSVSHDLRSPLRHIDGFISLLKNKINNQADDEVKHYLSVISGSAKKMDSLIDALLSYSRTGRTKINITELDPNEIIRDVITELSPQYEGRKINWNIERLQNVKADPLLLKLVFQNLLSNAVKFTRKREVAEITVKHENKNDEIVFSVQDNGVGFNMDYAEELFGVFQRLHSEKEYDGSGIGLANVRRIIARHGGLTWAVGYPDNGATFYFSLKN